MSGGRVLNDAPSIGREEGAEVAARLREDIHRLKSEFYDPEKERVDYAALRSSAPYRRYVEDTALLRRFDPRTLTSREERLAFWINLYNALVIHGVVDLEVRESVKEEPRFFRAVAYRVGDLSFTPDDIEHGILRGNRHPPHGILRPFSRTDPRLSLAVDPPDPRIHFALVCGSASCPPIRFYSPGEIDRQLDLASAGFVNGPGVEIVRERGVLRLSPIFKWYSDDFGGRKGVIEFLTRYLDPGEGRDFLIEGGQAAEVEWQKYDWSLNG